jgi:hypothetical protein
LPFIRVGGLQAVVDPGRNEAIEKIVEGLVVVHPDGPLPGLVVFIDVDLAEERLVEQAPRVLVGFEVGVEMGAAAAMGVPIIFVIPRNTKYRLDVLEYRGVTVKDYVHPHVASLAYRVVETFEDAGAVLAGLPSGEPARRGHVRIELRLGYSRLLRAGTA